MKLITKEILKKAPKLYETDGQKIKKVIAKFFHPMSSYTFYMVEYDPETGRMFGYVTGLICDEWGYTMLSELEDLLVRGLGIERDMYFNNKTIDMDGNIAEA